MRRVRLWNTELAGRRAVAVAATGADAVIVADAAVRAGHDGRAEKNAPVSGRGKLKHAPPPQLCLQWWGTL